MQRSGITGRLRIDSEAFTKVRDEYQTLREKHQPVNHPEEVLKALDDIVARASKELAV
jgi:hypothetical protein